MIHLLGLPNTNEMNRHPISVKVKQFANITYNLGKSSKAKHHQTPILLTLEPSMNQKVARLA
jgi:hypothetical protein